MPILLQIKRQGSVAYDDIEEMGLSVFQKYFPGICLLLRIEC